MLNSFNNQKAVEIYTKKRELFPVEKEFFRDYLSTPGRLLDLGCGTGRTTRPLYDMGHDVIGVDIASDMIEEARRLHPCIDFRVGDAAKLEFEDESFDYVLFSFNGLDYLYPLQNRLTALREIYRVLRTGGTFIYSSHHRNSLFVPSIRRIKRIRHHDGTYHRERTVYGDLVTYFGTKKNNMVQLEEAGFTDCFIV